MKFESQTLEEMEATLGDALKQLRLSKGVDQITLAGRAGISDKALRKLESGGGSHVRTLLAVIRALGREEWLKTVAPVVTINPLQLTRQATPRQRAPRRTSKPDQ